LYISVKVKYDMSTTYEFTRVLITKMSHWSH
jgi:hypothetical protein